MKGVERKDILDSDLYEKKRYEMQIDLLEIRRARRMQLGEHLVFLFENKDTIRLRLQEMMHSRLVHSEPPLTEEELQREVSELNLFLGRPGEVACTLLLEPGPRGEHPSYTSQWLELARHVYLRMEDGQMMRAYRISAAHADPSLLTQHLVFETKFRVPIGIGCDHLGVMSEEMFPTTLSAALGDDLSLGAPFSELFVSSSYQNQHGQNQHGQNQTAAQQSGVSKS